MNKMKFPTEKTYSSYQLTIAADAGNKCMQHISTAGGTSIFKFHQKIDKFDVVGIFLLVRPHNLCVNLLPFRIDPRSFPDAQDLIIHGARCKIKHNFEKMWKKFIAYD